MQPPRTKPLEGAREMRMRWLTHLLFGFSLLSVAQVLKSVCVDLPNGKGGVRYNSVEGRLEKWLKWSLSVAEGGLDGSFGVKS